MTLMPQLRQRGFTIVELLVVIVVIAILASVTIVAYNGIQTRAQTDKTVSAVHAYLNALEIFKADHGNYPNYATLPGISFYNCLGEDYNADMCWSSNGTYKENAITNSALKELLGSLPMAGDYGTITNSGILYIAADNQAPGSFWTFDGQPTNWLVYGVPNTTTRCPVGPVATYTGTTFTSAPPASGQTTAGTCWIAL